MARRYLKLFGTAGCHLCEAAEAICAHAAARGHLHAWALQRIEIAGDADLEERYGVRIPVLQADDGTELGWPFDEATLGRWLEDLGA